MKNKINNRNTGKILEESVRKNLLKEAEQAQGYKIYQAAHAESGKSNTEGLELATKKIKEFMKDSGETIPTPPMYRNNKKQDEFIEDVYYSSGQSGLEFDQPLSDDQKKRHILIILKVLLKRVIIPEKDRMGNKWQILLQLMLKVVLILQERC